MELVLLLVVQLKVTVLPTARVVLIGEMLSVGVVGFTADKVVFVQVVGESMNLEIRSKL